jgi:hypothetical protein
MGKFRRANGVICSTPKLWTPRKRMILETQAERADLGRQFTHSAQR